MILNLLYLLVLAFNTRAEKVKFVFELFRHGARDPLSNEWKNDKLFPDGNLTPVGMRQHYNLGKLMKKRFHEEYNLIKDIYDPNEIYVRAADVQRVIESAESHLLGMFEGKGPSIPESLEDKYLFPPIKDYNETQKRGSALPNAYQPVPIEIVPATSDYAIEAFFSCPTFAKYRENVENSFAFKLLRQKTLKSRTEIGKLLNLSRAAMINESFSFMDIMKAYEWSGLEIPHDVTQEIKEDLALIYNIGMFYGIFGSKTQQQLGSGEILKEVLNYFDLSQNKNTTLKLVIYSAHDTNIVSLLNAFNFSNPLCRLYFDEEKCFEYPPFASQVLLELFEDDDGKDFVRFVYNGDVLKTFSYEEFVKKSKEIIPDDYQSLCQGKSQIVIE